MPPETQTPFDPTDHLLKEGAHKGGVGAIVGTTIIVALLILGALYFWGAHLNQQNNPENNLPLIPGDSTQSAQ